MSTINKTCLSNLRILEINAQGHLLYKMERPRKSTSVPMNNRGDNLYLCQSTPRTRIGRKQRDRRSDDPSDSFPRSPMRRSRRRKKRPSSSPRSAVRKKKEKADGRRTHARALTHSTTDGANPHSPSLAAESGKSSRKVIIFR